MRKRVDLSFLSPSLSLSSSLLLCLLVVFSLSSLLTCQPAASKPCSSHSTLLFDHIFVFHILLHTPMCVSFTLSIPITLINRCVCIKYDKQRDTFHYLMLPSAHQVSTQWPSTASCFFPLETAAAYHLYTLSHRERSSLLLYSHSPLLSSSFLRFSPPLLSCLTLAPAFLSPLLSLSPPPSHSLLCAAAAASAWCCVLAPLYDLNTTEPPSMISIHGKKTKDTRLYFFFLFFLLVSMVHTKS